MGYGKRRSILTVTVMSYYVGIDLGGTNIVAAVVDSRCDIIAKAECKTNAPRSENEICDSMAEVALSAISKAGLRTKDIISVGIGVPGAANPRTGVVEYCVNLGFHNWDVTHEMEKRLGMYVYIENDANAAAYGEYLAGALRGARNAIAVTLGTGVGGGIIIDGKLYSGSNYAGGELGHIVIQYKGKPCACGRKGCWEKYASATALIELTKQTVKEHPEEAEKILSISGGIDNIDGETAFIAQKAGDKLGKAIVEQYIEYLACGLTNIINIFQPEIICIGGGISQEGDNLLKPLLEIVERERYTKHNDEQTQICIATLGNDAGIIGAAFLFEQH